MYEVAHLECLGEDERLHAVLVRLAPEVLDASKTTPDFAAGDEVI